jgi:hypothetical protein
MLPSSALRIADGTAFAAGPFGDSSAVRSWDARNGATMHPQTLEARVERLEERVTNLEELPARMDTLSTQISQLREEMHSGFSDLRDGLQAEIRAGDDQVMDHARELYAALKAQIQAVDERLVREIHAVDERLMNEIRVGDERVMSEVRKHHEELKTQIQDVDERVMHHTRLLYEDLKADLKLIKEGQSAGRRRRPKS